MSLRLAAVDEGGAPAFTEQLGRKRGSLLSSEEAELWRRLWAGGHTIAYDPAALLLHRVTTARMTRRWLVRRGWGQGRSNARLRVLTGEVAGAAAVRQICVAEAKFAVRLALRSARATLRGDAAGALDAVSRCAGHTAAGLEQPWLLVRRAGRHRDSGDGDSGGDRSTRAGPAAVAGHEAAPGEGTTSAAAV
jgi:hypothetical protein